MHDFKGNYFEMNLFDVLYGGGNKSVKVLNVPLNLLLVRQTPLFDIKNICVIFQFGC